MDSAEALSNSPYPGRGVAVCRTSNDGLCALYRITGRSAASKHRALVPDDRGLRVDDLGGSDDDPLRHYRAARIDGDVEIIGNGDHVDTMARSTIPGSSVDEVYRLLEPEPDDLGTPRVAAAIEISTGSVTIGGARRETSGPGSQHHMLGPTSVAVGTGLLIATYTGNPNSPSPWAGPLWISSARTMHQQIEEIWNAVDQECRVAVAGRTHDEHARWTVR